MEVKIFIGNNKYITFNERKYKLLVKEYDNALLNNKESIIFENEVLLCNFIKYMIEAIQLNIKVS